MKPYRSAVEFNRFQSILSLYCSTVGGINVTQLTDDSWQTPAQNSRTAQASKHHKQRQPTTGALALSDYTDQVHYTLLQNRSGRCSLQLATRPTQAQSPTGNMRPQGRNRYPMRSEAFRRTGCKFTFYRLVSYVLIWRQ